jgi:hypothetical protein
MALTSNLTLAGVSNIPLKGLNPAFVVVDDAGILYNSRTGSQLDDGDVFNVLGTANQIVVTSPTSDTRQVSLANTVIVPNVQATTWLSVGPTTPTKTSAGDLTANTAYFGNGQSFVITSYETTSLGLQNATVWSSSSVSNAAAFNNVMMFSPSVVTSNKGLSAIEVLLDTRNATGAWTSNVNLHGINSVISHGSNTNGNEMRAVRASSETSSTFAGTLAAMHGLYGTIRSLGSGGTIALASAIFASQPNTGGATLITDYAGVRVDPIASSKCGTSTGVLVSGVTNATTANRAIWIKSDIAGTGGGIVFGSAGDVALYRASSTLLQTSTDMMVRHLRSSSTPTISAGVGAGTSPPQLVVNGSDIGFSVTLTTGTPIGTGVIFTVTYGASWGTLVPRVAASPTNAAAAALSGTSLPYNDTGSVTQMTFRSGSVALAASTQYTWSFLCQS